MAGRALASELTNPRALAPRFAVATADDESAIRRLLRENPMQGAIKLTLEREPDYFHGADLGGGTDRTIVALAGDELVCMGRCSERECWIDGHATRVGYLAELRLDHRARGSFGILRTGYRFFHEQQRTDPATVYFTSIAADNGRALRLLERGVRGLPAYRFLAELETLLVNVPRRSGKLALRVEPGSAQHLPAMLRLLNEEGRRRNFAPVWTEEMLRSLTTQGLPLDRFLLAFDGPKMIGCGALWDQRAFRQTVVRGYSSMLSVARPAINFSARLFGTPRLPSPGSAVAQAFLSPLALAAGREHLLPDFIAAFFPTAREMGVEFLTLARPAGDPRLTELRRRFSTRTWRSRLYRADWPDTPPHALNEKLTFLPEVSFL